MYSSSPKTFVNAISSSPSTDQTSRHQYHSSDSALTVDERMSKFQYLVGRYEINRDFATRLRALEGYEIVFVVDGKSVFFYLRAVFKFPRNSIKAMFEDMLQLVFHNHRFSRE